MKRYCGLFAQGEICEGSEIPAAKQQPLNTR
jgi:hypothetical protein